MKFLHDAAEDEDEEEEEEGSFFGRGSAVSVGLDSSSSKSVHSMSRSCRLSSELASRPGS